MDNGPDYPDLAAIAVNQIELHLFNQQRDIVAYCRDHGIVVQAFCPLARSKRMDNLTLVCFDELGNGPSLLGSSQTSSADVLCMDRLKSQKLSIKNLHR